MRVTKLAALGSEEAVWAGLDPVDVGLYSRYLVHSEAAKVTLPPAAAASPNLSTELLLQRPASQLLSNLRWTSLSCRNSIRKGLDTQINQVHTSPWAEWQGLRG